MSCYLSIDQMFELDYSFGMLHYFNPILLNLPKHYEQDQKVFFV